MRRELAPGRKLLPEVHHGEGLVRQRQAGLQEPQRRAGLADHAEEGGLCPEGAADHERGGKDVLSPVLMKQRDKESHPFL